jgi:hypothetical protein
MAVNLDPLDLDEYEVMEPGDSDEEAEPEQQNNADDNDVGCVAVI